MRKLYVIVALALLSVAAPIVPPATAFSGFLCFKETVYDTNNGTYTTKEFWLIPPTVSSTNAQQGIALVAPAGAELANLTIQIGSSMPESTNTNMSPANQQLLRDQLIANGKFDPPTDTIFYFQSDNPLTYQLSDTLTAVFDFANGYPVEGNLAGAITSITDLNNGLPLTDYDDLVDSVSLNTERYFNRVFDGYTVTTDVPYATNISVLTGAPNIDTLKMDVYEPLNDSNQDRPLVLVLHPGFFLPPFSNNKPVGERQDSAVVETCKEFAQRGYVAAAISYRLGWNPISPNQSVRTGTYINAVYRGVQDARTAVRYFRMNATVGGNTFGVDTSRVAVGGFGSGGVIAMGVASLNKYSELNLAKFIDPNTSNSYVDTSLSGNLYATTNRPLCFANHVGYSSDIDVAFSLGGHVLDSSWIEANEPPVIAFHVPSDPLSPYNFGPIIIPTTGNFVLNVSGGRAILNRSFALGNQSPFTNAVLQDEYSYISVEKNDSVDGFYPFFRQGIEGGPWEWWDSSQVPLNSHQAGLQTNPDMSKEKAIAYLDTAIYYICRRLVPALSLPDTDSVLISIPPALQAPQVDIFPVPARGSSVRIRSVDAFESILIHDISGRQTLVIRGDGRTEEILDVSRLGKGIYFATVRFPDGKQVTKKVLLE